MLKENLRRDLLKESKYLCWKCKAPLDRDKIHFRDTCEACSADLHVCKNCRFWCPGKPNECLVPGTEWVADREKANYCEEFKLQEDRPKKEGPSSDDIASRLFKD